jgi:hypothetical protein
MSGDGMGRANGRCGRYRLNIGTLIANYCEFATLTPKKEKKKIFEEDGTTRITHCLDLIVLKLCMRYFFPKILSIALPLFSPLSSLFWLLLLLIFSTLN